MNSAVYFGQVRHARSAVVEHAFTYRHALLYLDLDELPQLFRARWLWSHERANLVSFHRRDYFGERELPLADAVRARVSEELGRETRGPVRVLTQPRFLGYVFNPVTFYYCFAPCGERLDAVVAEITNTPWNERHAYVIDARTGSDDLHVARARFAKRFHVSPFQPAELEYEWELAPPGAQLHVSMRNLDRGRPVFRAEMNLTRRPFDATNLARFLIALPGLSWRTSAAIYWQALRLRLAGAPFHEHPRHAAPAEVRTR